MNKKLLIIIFSVLFLSWFISEIYVYKKETKDYVKAMDERDSIMVKNFVIQ